MPAVGSRDAETYEGEEHGLVQMESLVSLGKKISGGSSEARRWHPFSAMQCRCHGESMRSFTAPFSSATNVALAVSRGNVNGVPIGMYPANVMFVETCRDGAPDRSAFGGQGASQTEVCVPAQARDILN